MTQVNALLAPSEARQQFRRANGPQHTAGLLVGIGLAWLAALFDQKLTGLLAVGKAKLSPIKSRKGSRTGTLGPAGRFPANNEHNSKNWILCCCRSRDYYSNSSMRNMRRIGTFF